MNQIHENARNRSTVQATYYAFVWRSNYTIRGIHYRVNNVITTPLMWKLPTYDTTPFDTASVIVHDDSSREAKSWLEIYSDIKSTVFVKPQSKHDSFALISVALFERQNNTDHRAMTPLLQNYHSTRLRPSSPLPLSRLCSDPTLNRGGEWIFDSMSDISRTSHSEYDIDCIPYSWMNYETDSQMTA
jgi:hypothetical protein